MRFGEPMCVLRVSGRDFDPRAYLAASSLQPYEVFRAGDPCATRRDAARHSHSDSGFMVNVSDHDELSGQVADAVTFLQAHAGALARLRATPGVDDVRLDFPIYDSGVAARFLYLSPELLAEAGRLHVGIELSVYAVDGGAD